MGVVPYHILTVCGDVIFAARGSHIDSLNTSLERISTWKHPLKEGGAGQDISSPAPAPAADGPPAKRRKVDAEDGQEQEAESAAAAKNGQEGKETGGGWEKPSNERPFIQGLVTTTDGRHVVAITGSDKTIWVLEHDGKGNLKQLSQRMMPKRPCSITLTSDNSTILSADKFGDVFSLPLIPTAQPQAQQPSENATRSRSSSVAPTPQPFKPQANELTVHTKRNLRALEHQKLAMQQQKAAAEKAAEARNFEHTLLLGHVSMLTAILSATTVTPSGSRREYVITADRDEHIRITRGIPQTHVIEGFCLGHEDFISRLCIPSSRPEVLISGGGDDDLFVWDWVNAKLLSKTNLLTHVQAVSGEGAEVSKVAVSRLYSFTHGGSTWVVVVCER
ncbi:hypothetical protein QBC46DRAFT_100683 [Diplogelasinospora grovesii]|uniref:Transfer RNA methyltransferase 82 n=1 Tax=Diplogelasinospora grovesii TaxID=303347 RepID=A0AAN6N9C1_9PEZI|nr:hypothetical protein QBC46DRAFT_100683 [Diplogelasinospora grovesii]